MLTFVNSLVLFSLSVWSTFGLPYFQFHYNRLILLTGWAPIEEFLRQHDITSVDSYTKWTARFPGKANWGPVELFNIKYLGRPSSGEFVFPDGGRITPIYSIYFGELTPWLAKVIRSDLSTEWSIYSAYDYARSALLCGRFTQPASKPNTESWECSVCPTHSPYRSRHIVHVCFEHFGVHLRCPYDGTVHADRDAYTVHVYGGKCEGENRRVRDLPDSDLLRRTTDRSIPGLERSRSSALKAKWDTLAKKSGNRGRWPVPLIFDGGNQRLLEYPNLGRSATRVVERPHYNTPAIDPQLEVTGVDMTKLHVTQERASLSERDLQMIGAHNTPLWVSHC